MFDQVLRILSISSDAVVYISQIKFHFRLTQINLRQLNLFRSWSLILWELNGEKKWANFGNLLCKNLCICFSSRSLMSESMSFQSHYSQLSQAWAIRIQLAMLNRFRCCNSHELNSLCLMWLRAWEVWLLNRALVTKKLHPSANWTIKSNMVQGSRSVLISTHSLFI